MIADKNIKVTASQLKRMKTLRQHPRETMSDILNRLMNENAKK